MRERTAEIAHHNREATPPPAARYLESAELLPRNGSLGRALAMVARITLLLGRNDPLRPKALAVLAHVYTDLGRYAEAKHRAAEALDLDPNNRRVRGFFEESANPRVRRGGTVTLRLREAPSWGERFKPCSGGCRGVPSLCTIGERSSEW